MQDVVEMHQPVKVETYIFIELGVARQTFMIQLEMAIMKGHRCIIPSNMLLKCLILLILKVIS